MFAVEGVDKYTDVVGSPSLMTGTDPNMEEWNRGRALWWRPEIRGMNLWFCEQCTYLLVLSSANRVWKQRLAAATSRPPLSPALTCHSVKGNHNSSEEQLRPFVLEFPFLPGPKLEQGTFQVRRKDCCITKEGRSLNRKRGGESQDTGTIRPPNTKHKRKNT